MRPKLKICGLMRASDVELCCGLGVDLCGFVTEYPLDVPWNLTGAECRKLLPCAAPQVKRCIVTGGSPEQVLSLALELRPDLVQLHFHETLEDTETLVKALAPYGIGVIKTIPTPPEERMRQFGTDVPEDCVRALCSAGVWAVLADSRGPDNAAGGGTLELSFCRRVCAAASRPVAVGGGITADNCLEVIQAVHPSILDVMTGVEDAPGVKSRGKLSALVGMLRGRRQPEPPGPGRPGGGNARRLL